MLLNYPFRRIFLGDGGAYLAGFWLAECGVLLLKRKSSVSTWGVLLVCIYPVWETVFSMYRRNVIHKVKSGMPDMTHLHHLLFKIRGRKHGTDRQWTQHGVVSLKIWALVAICQFIAINIYSSRNSLIWSTLLFAALYKFIYTKGLKNTHPDGTNLHNILPNHQN